MTNTNWHDEDGYPIENAEEKRKLLEDYFNGIPSVQGWTPITKGLPKEELEGKKKNGTDYYLYPCLVTRLNESKAKTYVCKSYFD